MRLIALCLWELRRVTSDHRCFNKGLSPLAMERTAPPFIVGPFERPANSRCKPVLAGSEERTR